MTPFGNDPDNSGCDCPCEDIEMVEIACSDAGTCGCHPPDADYRENWNECKLCGALAQYWQNLVDNGKCVGGCV